MPPGRATSACGNNNPLLQYHSGLPEWAIFNRWNTSLPSGTRRRNITHDGCAWPTPKLRLLSYGNWASWAIDPAVTPHFASLHPPLFFFSSSLSPLFPRHLVCVFLSAKIKEKSYLVCADLLVHLLCSLDIVALHWSFLFKTPPRVSHSPQPFK